MVSPPDQVRIFSPDHCISLYSQERKPLQGFLVELSEMRAWNPGGFCPMKGFVMNRREMLKPVVLSLSLREGFSDEYRIDRQNCRG
jgi:hypothetical protein